jgi:TonB family protein
MARTTALIVAVMAAAASPALAQTAWIAAPTAADMAAAYPEKARAEGIGGGVELMCTAARSGAMTDCAVLGETPRGYGFGAAARHLAGKLRAAGVVKDTEVRVPITFAAEMAGGHTARVRTPKWTALPSVGDMQAAVPKTEGGPNDVRVTLVCTVEAGGVLNGCAVDREEPAGQGFGQAILTLAPRFRVDLMSAEGMPTVGAKVRVPVRFDLKPVQQAAK